MPAGRNTRPMPIADHTACVHQYDRIINEAPKIPQIFTLLCSASYVPQFHSFSLEPIYVWAEVGLREHSLRLSKTTAD